MDFVCSLLISCVLNFVLSHINYGALPTVTNEHCGIGTRGHVFCCLVAHDDDDDVTPFALIDTYITTWLLPINLADRYEHTYVGERPK